MLEDESDREKQDYNLEQRPPPMGSRVKVTLSDESNRENETTTLNIEEVLRGNTENATVTVIVSVYFLAGINLHHRNLILQKL